MKAVGIVRNIDDAGRLVIPKGLRAAYGFEARDPVEIYVLDDGIFIKKYSLHCPLCGSGEELKTIGDTRLCVHCFEKIRESMMTNENKTHVLDS